MKWAAVACIALALVTAGCAPGGSARSDRYARLLKPTANPSHIIANEIAFARMAQEKGQWTAFAEYAADDAIVFTPEKVPAKAWLKGRANPAQAERWQTHQVRSSCDGALVVTEGAFQRPDGTAGVYFTVWERQPNGKFLWTVDQREVLATPPAAPDMIQTVISRCPDPKLARVPQPVLPGRLGKESPDGTLEWEISPQADGGRILFVRQSDGHFQWSDHTDQKFTGVMGQ